MEAAPGTGRTHNLSNRRRLIWVIGLSAGCSINSQRCSRDFRSRPDTAHRQRPTCTFARTCRRPAARIVNRAMAVPNPQPSTLPQASPLPLLSPALSGPHAGRNAATHCTYSLRDVERRPVLSLLFQAYFSYQVGTRTCPTSAPMLANFLLPP